MKRSILLVQDDALMREFITDYFKKEQWEVHEAENGRIALDIFEQTPVDLVVLDIMMPEMDGWSVCRRIRGKSDVPIIIMTARTEDDDQLLGFELGADEYVTKPLSPRVLVARATALMKRKEGTVGRASEVQVFGDLSINREAHVVAVKGTAVNLTPKEYELLIVADLSGQACWQGVNPGGHFGCGLGIRLFGRLTYRGYPYQKIKSQAGRRRSVHRYRDPVRL